MKRKILMALVVLLLLTNTIFAAPAVTPLAAWRGDSGLPSYRLLYLTGIPSINPSTTGAVQTFELPCNGMLLGLTLWVSGSTDFDIIIGGRDSIDFTTVPASTYGTYYTELNINRAVPWTFDIGIPNVGAPIGSHISTTDQKENNKIYIRFRNNDSINSLSLLSMIILVETGRWKVK